jgi:hypothetical protein
MLKRETQIRNAMATQQQLDDLNRSDRGDDKPPCPLAASSAVGNEFAVATSAKAEKQPETLDEAKALIAELRAQLMRATLADKLAARDQTGYQGDDDQTISKQQSKKEASAAMVSQEQEHAWEVEEREPQCDREVFESIKARVVREFNLGAEYVDVLNSAVARFPGDEDIVASANYLRYNRAVQGALEVGDALPMDDITLASLDGRRIGSMREHLSCCGDVGETAGASASSLQPKQQLPVAIVAGSIT